MSIGSQRRDLVVRIDAETKSFEGGLQKSSAALRGMQKELRELDKRQQAMERTARDSASALNHVSGLRARYEREEAARLEKRRQAMGQAGQASVAMGAAMAAGLALSVRAAVQWESAWAGVTKTVNGSAKQMGELEGQLRNLAKTLPASHQEIAAVAEAAGQLGVQRGDVAAFTKTMVDLGVSTNLSAEDAATGIQRMMNVMQTAPADVDRMGAALVALGNAGASTESDILQMAQRIAGAGSIVGASESDILALSNALSSMGVQAELGSGVMTRALLKIDGKVREGGEGLQGLADISGTTTREFSEAWGKSPVQALSMVTEGLGRVKDSGGDAAGALADIGFKGTYDRQVLLALASSGDLLAASLDLGTKAWKDNTALVNEANKRYETTESKMKIARNAVNDLAIDVGSTLLPALASAAGAIADLAGFLGGLPGPAKGTLAVLGTLAATVGIVGGVALMTASKIAALEASMLALGFSAGTTDKAMKTLGVTMKAGVVAAAAVGVGVAITALIDSFAEAAPAASRLGDDLLTLGQDGRVTGELLGVLGDDFDKIAAQVKSANSSKWWSFTEGREDVIEARDNLASLDAALVTMVQNGQGDRAARIFSDMADAVKRDGGKVSELRDSLSGYGEAQREANTSASVGTEEAQRLAAAVSGIDDEYTNAYSSLGAWTAAQKLDEDQTKEVTKQVEGWADALASFVQPLGAYTGLMEEKVAADRASAEARAAATESEKDGWEDYVGVVQVSVGEYLAELETQVQAQEKHADNMVRLAGRVSQGTLDELARMGPEGAPLVEQLVTASDAELAKLDDLFARRTKDATGAMAGELYLANTLLPTIAAKVGEDTALALAQKLAAGTTTVAQIAQDYAYVLAGGINPILESLGKKAIVNRARAGGNTAGYAEGGFHEDHTAQIAPAGAMRLWAEPETGGESYIPLAPSKRTRSTDIWRETGKRLGVDFAEFATGGFWTPDRVPVPPSTRPYGPPISTAADGTMSAGHDAVAAFVAQSMEQGGSGGSASGLLPIMAAARQYVMEAYGVRNIGGFARRNIAGTSKLSDHALGKAIDIMTSNLGLGWTIARDFAFGPARSRFRAENVIWQQSISSRGGAFRPMADRGSPTQNHRDHVHVDTFAKGGILNPHVRDAGGPLLPGYTFNGTGRPELVLPFASGGMWGPTASQVIRSGGQSVLYGAVTKAVWEALLKAGWGFRNDGTNKGMIWRPGAGMGDPTASGYVAGAGGGSRGPLGRATTARPAPATLTAATRGLTDPARIREAAQAWEEHRRALERNRELLREAQAAQYDLKIAKGTEQRAAAQKRLAEATKAINEQQAEDRLDRERAAVDRLVDSLERQAQAQEDARRAREDALARVNDLLDRERDVRARGAQAEQDYADRVARIQERSAQAAQDLAQQQQRLLDDRRDQLDGWARLDERAAVQWGNSVEQLLANARDQAAQFEQWSASLAEARARGVSEQVIAALGLDQGPQALGQLKQFGQATAQEIDALNAEVARRTALAGEQVSREQQAGYGELGRALQAAHADYTQALADLNEELVQAQADLLVEQAEVATELAAIGQNQARSYGEALEQGLRSQIPAVLAAAQALQAAAGGATGNATMVGGRYTDTMTGRAAFYGPNGEPAYASAKDAPAGAMAYRMPDNRTAYYVPSQPSLSVPVQQAMQPLVVHNYTVLDGQVIDHRVETKLLQQRGVATVTGSR